MKFKVHWIIDGIAEIEGESKEDAEKKLQESLEDYVKNSEDLMNKFIAKSIQGTAVIWYCIWSLPSDSPWYINM